MTELSQRPTGDGSVNEITGGYADVSDDSDSTKLSTSSLFSYVTDLFTFADPADSIPEGATIDSVQLILRVASESGGTAGYKGALKIGSTVYASSGGFAGSTPTNYTVSWALNPATGSAWLRSELNIEAGVQLTSVVSGKSAYCYEVWRKINYTEAVIGIIHRIVTDNGLGGRICI